MHKYLEDDLIKLTFAAEVPTYPKGRATPNSLGLLNDAGPPPREIHCFFPEGVVLPTRIKEKHLEAGTTKCLALQTLVESIMRDNNPAVLFLQRCYPFSIGGIAIETIFERHNLMVSFPLTLSQQI